MGGGEIFKLSPVIKSTCFLKMNFYKTDGIAVKDPHYRNPS